MISKISVVLTLVILSAALGIPIPDGDMATEPRMVRQHCRVAIGPMVEPNGVRIEPMIEFHGLQIRPRTEESRIGPMIEPHGTQIGPMIEPHGLHLSC